MAETLPRLRMDLEFSNSPLRERPGLLIRDPFHYSDAALIIPPALVQCLELFDGTQTDLDLRTALVQLTGDLQVGELQQHLVETLAQSGFLEDETYDRLKTARRTAFAEAPRREASQAGAAYPEKESELRATLDRYLATPDGHPSMPMVGIAAPHVSPEGGYRSYAVAYSALGDEYRDRTFVVLGTSHYGEPDRFGLTRKPFSTPLGEAVTDVDIVDRLVAAGGPAVELEDYCHAVEHSIEFQVVFLQHRFGAAVRIVPILCGPFAHAILNGGEPEDAAGVGRFLDALGELNEREGGRLFWVLGIDMAHMGARYGDAFSATAHEEQMMQVAVDDHRRIELLSAGDAGGFWAAVRKNRDPLKWCGSAPAYTFLRAAPRARGRLLNYEQWNIDDRSVVTFGAMAFTE